MDGPVDELFRRAADRMRANTGLKLTNEQKLELYSYYKQATEGKCLSPKPGFFDFTAKAKWEAWSSLGEMDGNKAMKLYIELVNAVDPAWESAPLVGGDSPLSPDSSSGAGSGPVVSTLAEKSEVVPENQKDLFDWCKEGRLDKIKECLKSGEDINQRDDEGMAVLHWTCDRGNTELIQFLLDNGADIEVRDSEGQTPLHYASFCGHREVVSVLLANGADKNSLDNSGESPVDVCDTSVKQLLN